MSLWPEWRSKSRTAAALLLAPATAFTASILDGFNFVMDASAEGQIYYDYYTEDERAADPTKEDMEQFRSADAFASWAGLVPGCNESAGKKKSTRIRKGNKFLKSTLVECARASIRRKDRDNPKNCVNLHSGVE